MAKFVCKQCLNKFVSYDLTNNKFCSQTCYWNSIKKVKVSVCKTCGKTRESWREYRYCSRECMNKDPERYKLMSKIRTGRPAWNKGKPAPWSVAPAPRYGKNNPNWKGDNVGMDALHNWIKRRLAKPLGCNDCGEIKPLDLANKSHEYKRDLHDWLWLCRKCHVKYDGHVKKSWETRKRRVSTLPR